MEERDISESAGLFALEEILDSIPDAVFAIDIEKRIRWMNQAAEKMSGLSRLESVGRPLSAILRSSMCQDSCAAEQSLKAGKPIIDAPAYVISGGKRIPVSISMAFISGDGGRVVGAVETVRELSGVAQRSQESVEELTAPLLNSRSNLMLKVLDQLPAIASSTSTVLIEGETGTGKELVARTIHTLSPRRHGPFVAVNCGAFPDTLLASELFGYKQGAFTDARKDKAGCFALAKGGALFLDDVEVMSLSMQAHLLRALQEHAYRPLGATRVERTDARFILASNQNVLELVRKGTFRSDLYYRVNVVRLELPPLRRRKEDVPFLVEQMVERFNRLASRFLHGIEPEALAVLMTYDWPGNVRELHNTIEHAFIKCDGHLIRIEHLPPEVTAIATLSSSDPDNCGEIQAIRAALVRNSFNRKATAKELGIAKTTLLRRMRRGGIQAYKDGRTKPISQ